MVRSMFILGALHSIEASFLADASLRKLRTAILKVVWSSGQPLANVGTVLSWLILLSVWSGSGFVCFVGTLLTGEVSRNITRRQRQRDKRRREEKRREEKRREEERRGEERRVFFIF